MKPLIIIGAGGFGREIAWLTERINQREPEWEIIGFLDDNPKLQGQVLNGIPVLGGLELITSHKDAYYVCAVGSSAVRKKLIDKAKALLPEIRFAVLIDPSVEMSRYVTVGDGSMICAHNILTVNISVGDHVIINLDCTVGHDSVIGAFATLYPSINISGGGVIGKGAELGTGAQVLQYKTIGENSLIGAGAVVVSDIPPHCVAVGVPAVKKKDLA